MPWLNDLEPGDALQVFPTYSTFAHICKIRLVQSYIMHTMHAVPLEGGATHEWQESMRDQIDTWVEEIPSYRYVSLPLGIFLILIQSQPSFLRWLPKSTMARSHQHPVALTPLSTIPHKHQYTRQRCGITSRLRRLHHLPGPPKEAPDRTTLAGGTSFHTLFPLHQLINPPGPDPIPSRRNNPVHPLGTRHPRPATSTPSDPRLHLRTSDLSRSMAERRALS